MLQCFYKYLFSSKAKITININCKKNKHIYLCKNTIINIYSLFFRKATFRSLITYINVLYSNIDKPEASNYFYFPKYMLSTNTNIHPGFLFKKYHIK